MTLEQIRTAALELAPAERERLAEELLLSIGKGDRETIDAAWLVEVRRRDALFQSGTTTVRPVDEVIDRIRQRTTP